MNPLEASSTQKLARAQKILWLVFSLVVLAGLVCAASVLFPTFYGSSLGLPELLIILAILLIMVGVAGTACFGVYLLLKHWINRENQVFF